MMKDAKMIDWPAIWEMLAAAGPVLMVVFFGLVLLAIIVKTDAKLKQLGILLTADAKLQQHDSGTPCPCSGRVEAARELLQRRMEQWQSHLPSDPNAPGTRRVRTHSAAGFEGETDYNSEVAIYREGIALMAEVAALLDAKETTHV